MAGGSRKTVSVGRMRHRVKITAWVETPDDDVGIVRERPPIAEVWAAIEPIKGMQLYGWKLDLGDQNTPTHKILIRTPHDFLVTGEHWIYTETRRETCWYKVMQSTPYGDDERYTELMVSKQSFNDRRADPETIDTPNEDPATQENQAEELDMDAPTLEAPSGLDRFMRK